MRLWPDECGGEVAGIVGMHLPQSVAGCDRPDRCGAPTLMCGASRPSTVDRHASRITRTAPSSQLTAALLRGHLGSIALPEEWILGPSLRSEICRRSLGAPSPRAEPCRAVLAAMGMCTRTPLMTLGPGRRPPVISSGCCTHWLAEGRVAMTTPGQLSPATAAGAL